MPATVGVPPGHERERLVGHVEVRGDARPATSRERGPTTAIVAHCSVTEVQADAQLRPLGLEPLLHPVEDRGGVAGRGGDQEAVVGDADHGAVVEDHAVDAAHHAVAARADLEAAHEVGVDPVEELAGVRALDVDLAEGGGVHDADAGRGPPRTRAAPPPPCPRPPAGSTRAASTGRRSRTRRRAATCQSWMAVTRTGSCSSPRSRPARAAKPTGRVRRPEGRRAELGRRRRRAARRRCRTR